MSNPLDFDRYPHECEIVIPILLKTPIYIEPIVIEKNEVCHRQSQPDKGSSEPKPVVSEPVPLADKEQAITRPWRRVAQSITGAWRSFSRTMRNLFKMRLSGRESFSQ